MAFTIGNPTEQAQFCDEHRLLLEKLSKLNEVVNTAFMGKLEVSSIIDKLVFSLGYSCTEDFGEILLLCGNGYGIGAQKILRGMYERAVTAWYLHDHPEKAEVFLDFGGVRQYQFMKKVKETFGETLYDAHPDGRKNLEEARVRYEKAKQKFMIACKRCGDPRLNHNWTELDFVSMASKVEVLGLPAIIRAAYDIPTQQAHATMSALLSKMELRLEGRVVVGRSVKQERNAVKSALCIAHIILLRVLRLQFMHFGLATLEQPLQCCDQDFGDIWPTFGK